MLNHFRLTEYNAVTTPMDPGVKLSKVMCPKSEEDQKEMDTGKRGLFSTWEYALESG